MLEKENRIHNTTLPPFITTNIPLKDKNWFATGGPARFFC